MEETVRIETTGKHGVAVVNFNAACISDVDTIAHMSESVKRFVQDNHPARIVFDFSGVKFFSSQVLGLLLETRAEIIESGGEVVISAIEPQLHRVFKITNLDKIFQFYADRDAAVKAFGDEASKSASEECE